MSTNAGNQMHAQFWVKVNNLIPLTHRPTVGRLLVDCRPTCWPLFNLITYKMRQWCVGGMSVTHLGLIELLNC